MTRLAALVILAGASLATAQQTPPMASRLAFQTEPGRVEILVGEQPVVTYFYQDATITRPYLAHFRTTSGVQVSRRHPPVEGSDPTDHPTMHPGAWLAFGDLSGEDDWRLKAKVVHESFISKPAVEPDGQSGEFTVANRYLTATGADLCRETCHYAIHVRPDGYLITSDSKFRSKSKDQPVVFGDQEEMGFGVRLAPGLSVKGGGRLTNSEGRSGERAVRGQTADWCEGEGKVGGAEVGLAVLVDPGNFRPSWFHARDYGLIVANPFGRHALTGGEPSRVLADHDEGLRLGFGLRVHEGANHDTGAAYRDYLGVIGRGRP